MREISVREANQNFSRVVSAAERGEAIVVAKNGRPVAKIIPQSQDRGGDPEWRASFAALEESLRSKRVVGPPCRGDNRGRQIRRRWAMTRVALDGNILIYAEIEPDSAKGMRSVDL